MLVPGFTVRELPVRLKNQNNLRFAPDGSLTSLGYDGRIWRIRDTDGDGLEDKAEPYWSKSTLSVPVGMAWSTAGLYVSSHGKVSLIRDLDGDGVGDTEEIVASGWAPTDVGSGGVDATAVTLDSAGNVYFGLLVADYSNAYRLRKRQDLTADEKAWLVAHGRAAEGAGEEEVSLYDLQSPRGTIQKLDPRTTLRTTIATGIRVPYSLAFNAAGDLFNTDQEGETWMPRGNPLDELNHIVPGRHYGFPPRHPHWLPEVTDQAPVVGFGPQHQSACGFVFNDPVPRSVPSGSKIPLPATPGQGLFGPKFWQGNAIVAGESRGKLWRVPLTKTDQGYLGKEYLFARIPMLVTDVAISPKGDLYVSCHSGQPDWGTGPDGDGKIFKISYTDPAAPQPIAVWASSPTEVRVKFNGAVDETVTKKLKATPPTIEFGEYVRAADRLEVMKPSYEVVQQQDATPRGHLKVLDVRLEDAGRLLVLVTEPHSLAVHYAVSIPGVKPSGRSGEGETIELDYDLLAANEAPVSPKTDWDLAHWNAVPGWALPVPASSGTESRPAALVAGDWEEGRNLFVEKLQCAKCHRIRGVGATVGPDLSNLVHRDVASVLRDIRDPNATLHPDYVTYAAELRNGPTVQGFLRSSTADSVTLFDALGQETVLARQDIVNLHPTGQSLMPTGLLDGLGEGQVRDLLTFLLREPPLRSRSEVEASLKSVLNPGAPEPNHPLRLVLVASKQDHGPGQHDYPAWQHQWRSLLTVPGKVSAETAWEWPSPEQFKSADVVLFYFWNHDWSGKRLEELTEFQKRGGGLVLLHSAVIADSEPEALAKVIGLSAQPGRTGYRHTPFTLELSTNQSPVIKGLPTRMELLDEPYWPMIGDTNRVTVLASADIDGAARPLIWTFERENGRVFASVPGHYLWTLNDPYWRAILLRGIGWAARRSPDTLFSPDRLFNTAP
jgi:putative heme-binding domain-containing protein